MTFNSTDVTHSITLEVSYTSILSYGGFVIYKFHNSTWTVADTFNEVIGTGESLHVQNDQWKNRILTVPDDVTVYAEIDNPQSQLVPFSTACFVKGTLITSDQGDIAIEKLDPSVNTINNKK